MNIRITDNGGKVSSGAMDNGRVIKLPSNLKAAAITALDIWAQEYTNQDFETFTNQLMTALRFEHENSGD